MKQFLPNAESALIFNIQHFCLHDGPGIRTAVFFSGCPLTCPWCCNPESAEMTQLVMHDERKCIFCKQCAAVCPQKAIEVAGGRWKLNKVSCDACGVCKRACPEEAIEISGKVYTLEEAEAEVIKDQAFYEKSGGGVTLSGGEVLMQAEFAEHFAERLKQKGIHIACETTAAIFPERFTRLVNFMDCLLVDLKHYDKEKLRKICGLNLDTVCENIQTAISQNKEVIGRIPVIPGFNDSEGDIEKIGELGKKLGIRQIHLLPFHQLGERKYECLQKEYTMKSVAPLHQEDMEIYKDCLQAQGFHVEIGG